MSGLDNIGEINKLVQPPRVANYLLVAKQIKSTNIDNIRKI